MTYGGKTFHVTPAGKHLPLGAKQNWFTKCMSKELKGNLTKKKGNKPLTKIQREGNENTFRDALDTCSPKRKAKAKSKAT